MVASEYSFELKNDLSELKALHQHLNHYGKAVGLSESSLFEIVVCLDELFTNIVSYGFKDKSAHLIVFAIKKVRRDLIIDVEDGGVPFNPLEAKNPRFPTDLAQTTVGGLGIHIVKQLMDDVCYKREQNRNKLTLKKCLEKTPDLHRISYDADHTK